MARGEKNGASKLTESEVLKIREMSRAGIQGKVIAKEFGVGESAVSSVIIRKTWKHV